MGVQKQAWWKWKGNQKQGKTSGKRIEYGETFSLIAILEAIRMLFAFAAYKGFVLYQLDVKSAFLNGFIFKKVYVKQPPSFWKWNLFLIMFLIHQKLYMVWNKLRELGIKDLAFFCLKIVLKEEKYEKGDFLIVQIYIDDIIFCATN